MSQLPPNRIIIAPLNWGWGHATRCIPIINEIISLDLIPVIASDGSALEFLKKEFPDLEFLYLPSYGIKYGKYFKLSMLFNIPKIISAILKENRILRKYVESSPNKVLGIISDNRLGIYHSSVPSVYITHQLNIKAGFLSVFVNRVHHHFIKKHKECWIPDEKNSLLSGSLSITTKKLQTRYIGILSRLKKEELSIKYDLLVLLSGIEEQRMALEKLMSRELRTYKGRVLLVRGSLKPSNTLFSPNITVVDYLLTDKLEKAINSSKHVISRSGYSTIMDLARLGKKAFFIPTLGQTEQEYLARYLADKNFADYSTQQSFKMSFLKRENAEVCFKNTPQHDISKYLIDVFKLYLM